MTEAVGELEVGVVWVYFEDGLTVVVTVMKEGVGNGVLVVDWVSIPTSASVVLVYRLLSTALAKARGLT